MMPELKKGLKFEIGEEERDNKAPPCRHVPLLVDPEATTQSLRSRYPAAPFSYRYDNLSLLTPLGIMGCS